MFRKNKFNFFILFSVAFHLLILFLVMGEWTKNSFYWKEGGTEGRVEVMVLMEKTSGVDSPANVIPALRAQRANEGGNPNLGPRSKPLPGAGMTTERPLGNSANSIPGSSPAPEILSQIRNRIERAKLYPLLARRQNLQGSVELVFEIDPEGRAQKISVLHSSGAFVLDQEALATLNRAAPFPYYEGEIRIALKFEMEE